MFPEGNESISKARISMFQAGGSGSNLNTSCYFITAWSLCWAHHSQLKEMFHFSWLLWDLPTQEEALAPASQKMPARAPGQPVAPGPCLGGTRVDSASQPGLLRSRQRVYRTACGSWAAACVRGSGPRARCVCAVRVATAARSR